MHNRRGTTIRFKPDPEIFGPLLFSPTRLYRLCRSKAYLFRGVEIRWACDPALLAGKPEIPAEAVLHFPGGLRDSLEADIAEASRVLPALWAGEAALPGEASGKLEWAAAWLEDRRRLPPFLLQHDPDARRRHARGRLPRRAAEGPARLGRAPRQPPRRRS